ncbi:MAG: HlyD family efflux transporter periplasmic adaptor subunit [Halioglobus sp.]
MTEVTQLEQTDNTTAAVETSSPRYLEQGLWAALEDASTVESFALQWLSLQCAMINGVRRAVVIWRKDADFEIKAQWPDQQQVAKQLALASETALRQQQGVVKKFLDPQDESSSYYHIAFPLMIDSQLYGVVTVEVEPGSQEYLAAVMRQLQWGSIWFDHYQRRQIPALDSDARRRLETLGSLLATFIEAKDFQSAAAGVTTELATELGCERVCLGFVKGRNHEVVAISHSANFDKKKNLIQAMGEAMDEASDQVQTIVSPSDGSAVINQAHELLRRDGGVGSLCTVPVLQGDQAVGAVLFEHHDPNHFGQAERALCEEVAMLMGPLLELRHREERSLVVKIADAAKQFAQNLVGPSHFNLKAGALVAVLLLLVTGFSSVDYRVGADAVLEGWVQRSVAAPFDGYVADVEARAGDLVTEGDILFRLDDRDLQLELLKLQSQQRQVDKEYLEAMVAHDKATVGILKARADQVDANLSLVQEQLKRTVARAPFDGIVVTGDLSQELGSPVQKGDILMQVAPLDDYRVILDVDERSVRDLAVDQSGKISLASMPGDTFDFSVRRITPLARVEEGVNVFRVEARLEGGSPALRPGMQGTGKILVGERSLLWVWTHGFVDWLRIWSWTWLP